MVDDADVFNAPLAHIGRAEQPLAGQTPLVVIAGVERLALAVVGLREHLHRAVCAPADRLRVLDAQVLDAPERRLERTRRVAGAALDDQLVVARRDEFRRVRLEELLRHHLVDHDREGSPEAVLQEHRRALVVEHHVESRHAEDVPAVDEVHRPLLLEVHHVVDPHLRQRLVGDDLRDHVREVEPDRVVEPERELQRVPLRVERRVGGRERAADDAADDAEVGVDPDEPRALELLDRLERAVDYRRDLDCGQPALCRHGLDERALRHRLLGDVAAEVRGGLRRRAGVLADDYFMPCHSLFSPFLLLFPTGFTGLILSKHSLGDRDLARRHVDAVPLAEPAPGVDLERVLALRQRLGEPRLDVLQVRELDRRARLRPILRHQRHVLVGLLRVGREVRSRDGEEVRPRNQVVLERGLVEHGVDGRLRALGVVDRDDPREQRLEGVHLDRLDDEHVHPLDPRAGEAREGAADVVADGRDAVEVGDVPERLVVAHGRGERLEDGADGGRLVAGVLGAELVGLAGGDRALVLGDPDIERFAGEIPVALDRYELNRCHFGISFLSSVASGVGGSLFVFLPSPAHPCREDYFPREGK